MCVNSVHETQMNAYFKHIGIVLQRFSLLGQEINWTVATFLHLHVREFLSLCYNIFCRIKFDPLLSVSSKVSDPIVSGWLYTRLSSLAISV